MIIALAVNIPGDENRLKPKPTDRSDSNFGVSDWFLCPPRSDLGESRVLDFSIT